MTCSVAEARKTRLRGWRALRVALLSVGIVAVWYETDFPWDEGCQTYVWLNAAFAALLLLRVIRWPGFLWLDFLTGFLAAANWGEERGWSELLGRGKGTERVPFPPSPFLPFLLAAAGAEYELADGRF